MHAENASRRVVRPSGNRSERTARFARPDSHKWKPAFIDCLKILNNISPDCARYLIQKLHYAMHSCCKVDTVGVGEDKNDESQSQLTSDCLSY